MKLTLQPIHSLRARLTIWNGLVVAAVLVAFTVAVYTLLATSLYTEMDRSLVERAQQVEHGIPPRTPSSASGRQFPPPEGVIIPRPNTFASADTFVQIVTVDGTFVASSENLAGAILPITSEDLAAVGANRGSFTVASLQGEQVRVFTAPLMQQGQLVGVIQVARALNRTNQALVQLRLLAGVGMLIAVALSAFVVWFTAGTALRPVENVIETAETIGSSGDLGRRVVAPSSQDEVGRLAVTFNRMLDRLEASTSALQQAFSRAETALDAQRRFAADASHELRTPLTTIRNNAGLLTQYPDVSAEDRAAAIEQINQEAERMTRLVQDLLTLARADAGQTSPQEPVALGPLVTDAAAQAQMLSRGQHVISTEIVQGGQVIANADALRQLLLLLLDNAVKYTPAGGRIAVRLEPEGDDLCLNVADTGVGIDPEDLPHIFERFYRADRSRSAGGTGLGLSIAKWIVEQYGGSIGVTSTPGQGSVFTVRFPQAPPATA